MKTIQKKNMTNNTILDRAIINNDLLKLKTFLEGGEKIKRPDVIKEVSAPVAKILLETVNNKTGYNFLHLIAKVPRYYETLKKAFEICEGKLNFLIKTPGSAGLPENALEILQKKNYELSKAFEKVIVTNYQNAQQLTKAVINNDVEKVKQYSKAPQDLVQISMIAGGKNVPVSPLTYSCMQYSVTKNNALLEISKILCKNATPTDFFNLNFNGNNAISWIFELQDPESLQKVIESTGFSINTKCGGNKTILDWAMLYKKNSLGKDTWDDMIKAVAKLGADTTNYLKEVCMTAYNADKHNLPGKETIIALNKNLASLLIEGKVDTNATVQINQGHYTILDMLTTFKDVDLLETLCKNNPGFDVNHKDLAINGLTAVDYMVLYSIKDPGYKDLINFFIKKGADVTKAYQIAENYKNVELMNFINQCFEKKLLSDENIQTTEDYALDNLNDNVEGLFISTPENNDNTNLDTAGNDNFDNGGNEFLG